MGPKRHTDIFWRVEKQRETQALEGVERGDDCSEIGTVTLISGGQMHQLNLIGGMIWNLCDGQHSIEEISSELALEFEADSEELIDDVRGFVSDLQARGWIDDE